MDKLKQNTKLKATEVLSESKFFNEKDQTQTDVPMVNVALSGSVDGGLSSGLIVLAGPSKHFKTSFALMMASSYLKKHKDSVMLFYDSEFGSPQAYFEQFDIDTSRVLHTPITNVEELKFDLISQLDNMDRKDNVIVVIDSIGNLASKKEMEDTMNEKSVADMSRAKALKGLFRMAKAIVGGGTGIYYSADNIWILGRRQNKTGTEVTGYDFIINVEKSRYVKEKSKIPVSVSWEGGIEKYSGLLEVAMAGGYVVKPNAGWYQESKVREKETLKEEFWQPIFDNTDFKEFIKKQYTIGHKDMVELDIE